MTSIRFASLAAALGIVAGVGAAAAWPSAKPVAPEVVVRAAPDQTRGMALMSVVVGENTLLLRGSGVVSVSNLDPGFYEVTFARSIRDCAYSTTLGGERFGSFYTDVHLSVIPSATEANVMRVGIFDAASMPRDAVFSMIVFCAE